MGYLSIECLYKHQDVIAEHREWWALEKVHGTSAHLVLRPPTNKAAATVRFSSGGANWQQFVRLFDEPALLNKWTDLCLCNSSDVEGKAVVPKMTIYGEAYGAKLLGMSSTYGNDLHFIVFDIAVEGMMMKPALCSSSSSSSSSSSLLSSTCRWLSVPEAASIADKLGLEFVPYKRIPSTVTALNAARDEDSEVAVRRGRGTGKLREGIVLRPLKELVDKHGNRVIYKHKRVEFSAHKTYKALVDTTETTLSSSDSIATAAEKKKPRESDLANDWVTPMRLQHVATALSSSSSSSDPSYSQILDAMVEDIRKESVGELDLTPTLIKLIKQQTSRLLKKTRKG